jgi:hypothetical protein
VGTVQLAYHGAILWYLGATLGDASIAANLAALAFVIIGTVSTGEYLEGSSRHLTIELVRTCGVVAMVLATGQWFGRELDEANAALISLGVINIVTSAWAERLQVWTPRQPPSPTSSDQCED